MTSVQKPFSLFYVSLAGLVLFFIALGSCRFSYPPIMPLLVSEHWNTLPQAGYLGSANFVGYFIGVLFAPIIGRYVPRAPLLTIILIIAVLSLAFCAWNLSFMWVYVWRIFNGISGGAMMVFVPSLILTNTPDRYKALVTGIMFAGAGVGTVVLSELVPVFNILGGVAAVWLGFAVITLVMAVIAYPLIIKTQMPLLKKPQKSDRLTGNALTALLWGSAAYFVYGLAVTPHYLFLADYAQVALHASLNTSSLLFSIQGIGLAVGGLMGGWLKSRLGTFKGLLAMVLISTVSVVLILVFKHPWAVGISGFILGTAVIQIVMLMSLHLDDIVGVHRHAQYWSNVTLCYAIAQFVGGYLFSGVLAMQLPYISMFWIAFGFMILTLGLYWKMR